ncbi:MAG: vWA domain-containing protein [bacterium]
MRLNVGRLVSFLVIVVVSLSIPLPVAFAGHDYILLVDHSNSMGDNDPSNIRLDGATLVVDSADEADQIAIVVFGVNSEVLLPLTRASRAAKKKICDQIHSLKDADGKSVVIDGNGTDYLLALNIARKFVEKSTAAGGRPEVILLTDGKLEPVEDWPQRRVNADMEKALAPYTNDVPVHCIALSDRADPKPLHKICAATGGEYFSAKTPSELLEVYLKILTAGKGMVSIKADQFYVWPASRELNVVLFKNSPKSSVELASEVGRIDPAATNCYSSDDRKTCPRFYNFVRVASPAQGTWTATAKGKGSLQIHALQSVPFEFAITSPRDGKQLAGVPVELTAVLQPKPGVDPGVIEQLVGETTVRAVVTNSEKESRIVVMKGMQRGATYAFTATESFSRVGDYTLQVCGEFSHGKTKPWMAERQREFYVGPSDFRLDVLSPKPGHLLKDPYEGLEFSGLVVKADPRCVTESLSPGSQIVVELLDAQGKTVLAPVRCDVKKNAFSATLIAAGAATLDPGPYRMRVTASDSQHVVQPAEVTVVVGAWPKFDQEAIKGKVENLGTGVPAAGGNGAVVVRLSGAPGSKPLEPGDRAGSWKIETVACEISLTDGLGLVPLSPSKDAPKWNGPFGYPARASGPVGIGGTALVQLRLVVADKVRYEAKLSVSLESLKLIIPARVDVLPPELVLNMENPKAVMTNSLTLRSWWVETKDVYVEVSSEARGTNLLSLPREWLRVSQQVKLNPMSMVNGAPVAGTTALPFSVALSEEARRNVRYGEEYRGGIEIRESRGSGAALCRSDIRLMVQADWPDKNEFAITHTLPTTVEVNTPVSIYENELSTGAAAEVSRGNRTIGICGLVCARDKDKILKVGGVIGDRYLVKELTWKWVPPLARYQENEKKDAAGWYYAVFVPTPDDVGDMQVLLCVEKLVLALKDAPDRVQTYSNISMPVKITVTEKK